VPVHSNPLGGVISRALGIPHATSLSIHFAVNELVRVDASFFPTPRQVQDIAAELEHGKYWLCSQAQETEWRGSYAVEKGR
jgi:hypothetical protein